MLIVFVPAILSRAQTPSGSPVFISEFMAANTGFLRDQDGDSPDWIELSNFGTAAVDLEGWSLSDDPANPRKWVFPKTNLVAQSQLVVFASSKNRTIAGGELHTSFSLAADGEYLGLFNPSGRVAADFAPTYPPQVANVSFGTTGAGKILALIGTNSLARILVPATDLGTNWILPGFDDSSWTPATNGIGFETASADFASLLRTDLRAPMLARNASCYLRFPFVVDSPDDLRAWLLRLHYDDGCAVWLNGHELFRQNAPQSLSWNASATSARPNADAVAGESFELGGFPDPIVVGTNLLAIHALNLSSNDSDFLVLPKLDAVSRTALMSGWRYFPVPTAGRANNAGIEMLGPLIQDPAHSPNEPGDNQDLQVTVKIAPAFRPLKDVLLTYRIMFSNEVSVAMFDDGLHGDGAARDGTFGAVIPAAASLPGEMIRYRITASDSATNLSRWPPYFDSRGSAQYLGTVVTNLALTNALPVVHWFVQNRTAAETSAGTRCSLSYAGEFYDNIFIRIRGGTSIGWPKKSYKLEFNEGEHFLVHPALSRVSEFDLNTTYTDKSYNRAALHFELQRDAGLPSPLIFHVRVQQNNAFYSVALYTEQPDADFLRRVGLDDQGALYKCNPGSTYDGTSSFEKKTRRNEGMSDAQALIQGLRLSGPALENFVFDNIDLPGMANYMATVAIAQNIDGSDKNHFLYRDTRGSREWFMLPWDLDLSFGPNALNTDTMVATQNYTSHPFIGVRPYLLHDGKYNRLLEAMFKVPRARQMVIRRVRTLTGQFLDSGYFSNRIDQLIPILSRDVELDKAKWRTSAHFPGTTYTLQAANDRIKSLYLRPRGAYLKSKTIPGITNNNVEVQPSVVSIQIGQIDFNPSGGNQAQEFIELLNTNLFPVELTGWRIAGAISHQFKPATVIPSNSALYLSPNASAFRTRSLSPRGNEGRFVQDGYPGQLSARGGRLEILNDRGQPVAEVSYPGDPSAAQNFLRITELMFHPASLTGDIFEPEQYEYLALQNIGRAALALHNVRFIRGLAFDFSASRVTHLLAGQTLYLVRNLAAFTARYGPGFLIAGEYSGQLDNSGETIALVDSSNESILEFRYEDIWQQAADGQGPSLTIANLQAPYHSWTNAFAWVASTASHGSPALFDNDKDGAANLFEIVAGTDPSSATDKPGFQTIQFDGSALKLRFRAIAGRHYRVLATHALGAALWSPFAEMTASTDHIEELADPVPLSEARFYRLLISR